MPSDSCPFPPARKAKQDEAGAVVPDAIVNRRQKKKEKTFEYEVQLGTSLSALFCRSALKTVAACPCVGRRALRRSLRLVTVDSYVGQSCQVKWQFKSMDNNTWVEKDILVKMGYIKLVQREDERNSPSLTARPLGLVGLL